MTPNERSILASTAIAVTLVMLLGQPWFIVHRELNVDEFEHAHAAWSFSHGLIPYRDFFEHHTPFLYFLAAPTFAHATVETNADAAVAWLMWARVAMLAVTLAVIGLVYAHGARGHDRWIGLLAVALLATSSQFMDTMLEFRPDVPALLCWLTSLLLARIGWQSGSRLAWGTSGVALGCALMFTQKYVFAGPGVGAAVLIYIASAARRERLTRLVAAVTCSLGVAVPIAITIWWFVAQDAFTPFAHYNLGENVRLNGQWFSPLPRVLANLLHSPALVIPGLAGLTEATSLSRRRVDDQIVLVAPAFSLIAGLAILGRVYEQYWIMFLPLLAIFGAEFLERHASDIPAFDDHTARWRLRALALAGPIASFMAFVILVPERASIKGVAEIGAFTASAALAGFAIWRWTQSARVASAAILLFAVVALAVGNLARGFYSNAHQFADLRYVVDRTKPDEMTFAASAGAGVFRPHAWYYFFHSGPFATDREIAEITSAIVSGRIQPRIVMLDDLELPIPPAIWTYVTARYRRVSPLLWDRGVTGDRTNTAAKD